MDMTKTVKREEVANALESLITNIKEDIKNMKKHNCDMNNSIDATNNFVSSSGREQGMYGIPTMHNDKKLMSAFQVGMVMGLKQALEEVSYFEDSVEEMK